MPLFEIEQYELHTSKFRVDAASEAEAIAKLLNREDDVRPVADSLEFIEIACDFGLPVDEDRELASELRGLGITLGDDVIPGIRDVTQIEPQAP